MRNLAGPFLIIVLLQIIFAAVFVSLEDDWDMWTALYHCFVTCTTVGYGDVAILTDGGKFCSIVHILISVCILTAVIADVDQLRDKRKRLLQRASLLKKKLDRELITSLDRCVTPVKRLWRRLWRRLCSACAAPV